MGRTDPKKWEGLTQKMKGSDSKNEKDWLGKMRRLTWKVRRTDSKKMGWSD